MDPDAWMLKQVTAEARNESFFMLLGFCFFAVVPSLIYTWVPAVLYGNDDKDSSPIQNSINPNSLVISITSCVMCCLGVWKSRFLDSNWLLFGVETVLVLLLCIAVAYGLGAILNKIFLPSDYLLEVAISKVTKAQTVATKSALIAASSVSNSQPYSGHLDF